jgi:hypothetical protein
MANCRPYIPSYIEPECIVEGGSVVAVAFIDKSITFTNITNPAQWVDQSYASDIIIFPEVRGSYAKPSVTEVQGKGKQATRPVGRNHEVVFRVSGIKGNDVFWNAMNKSTNYTFAFVVGGSYSLLMYTSAEVSIDAAPEVQEGLDTEVDWLVSVKWSKFDVPSTSNVPAGVFN